MRAAPVYFRAHESDTRRRHGQLRLVRRCDPRRARQHGRLRGPACDQGDDASEFAAWIPDGRVSGEAWPDRSHCSSQEDAAADRAAPRLLLERALNYREALAWLYGTQLFGIKLGLDNIQRLLAALQLPAPKQRILHIAGTNGKGSVCAMLNSILRAQNYRTGLFTSPHLITFRERIQVDGEMIAEGEVASGL